MIEIHTLAEFVIDQENRSRPGKKQVTEHDQEICEKSHKKHAKSNFYASKSKKFACGAPGGRMFVLRSVHFS